MASETAKAPTAGDGGALGIVVHRQAIDSRDIAPPTTEIQAWFVRRRARIASPHHARMIAELAFYGRAA